MFEIKFLPNKATFEVYLFINYWHNYKIYIEKIMSELTFKKFLFQNLLFIKILKTVKIIKMSFLIKDTSNLVDFNCFVSSLDY